MRCKVCGYNKFETRKTTDRVINIRYDVCMRCGYPKTERGLKLQKIHLRRLK